MGKIRHYGDECTALLISVLNALVQYTASPDRGFTALFVDQMPEVGVPQLVKRITQLLWFCYDIVWIITAA